MLLIHGKAMNKLVEIKGLNVIYKNPQRDVLALNNISLEINQGEIFGLVGESGSGKSTLGSAIMRLLPVDSIVEGKIFFKNQSDYLSLCALSEANMRKIRGGEIAMVFQEPAASFNPVYTIGYQIAEILKYRLGIKEKKQITLRIVQALRDAGLQDVDRVLKSYPHQLSGGMLQRAMIAQALCVDAKLLIADEPTSSLDVTIESKILNLLLKLRKEKGLSILFITHDLDVAATVCDRVAVLYEGELQDLGTPDEILNEPSAEYTKGLVQSFRELGEIC